MTKHQQTDHIFKALDDVKNTRTEAELFCEQMAAVAHSYKLSVKVSEKFNFKKVVFKKHDDKKGLRFSDGSKIFFGDKPGTFILPIQEVQ